MKKSQGSSFTCIAFLFYHVINWTFVLSSLVRESRCVNVCLHLCVCVCVHIIMMPSIKHLYFTSCLKSRSYRHNTERKPRFSWLQRWGGKARIIPIPHETVFLKFIYVYHPTFNSWRLCCCSILQKKCHILQTNAYGRKPVTSPLTFLQLHKELLFSLSRPYRLLCRHPFSCHLSKWEMSQNLPKVNFETIYQSCALSR